MPAASVVDSASVADGGMNEQALTGDAPAVESIGSTEDTDGVGASQGHGSSRERKRGLPAEFIDSSGLGKAKKQRPAPVEGFESGDKPDPHTPARKPLPDHLQVPDARIHQPPSTPPQSNIFSSAIADSQPTTVVELSLDYPSVPTTAVSSNPPANIATTVTGLRPALELGYLQNRPAASISTFEGAKDVTVTNSSINTVAGNFNQSVFKFDGSRCSR